MSLVRKPEDLESLCSQIGPCPRDIVTYANDPEMYVEIVKNAAQALENVGAISNLFRATSSHLPDYSHRLILMDRRGPINTQSWKGDLHKTQIKGNLAVDTLRDRFIELSSADVHHLLSRCSTVTAAAAFYGYVFEQFAIRCISLNDTDASVFHLYAKMSQSSQLLSGKFPVHFAYQPSPAASTHLQGLPGLRQRRITRWKETDTGRLSDERIYVPMASNNALFDSFFIDCATPTVATLWILQMTVSSTHDGAAKGFKTVANLKKKVETELRSSVEVKYVLVVPCKEDAASYEVTWDMAKEYRSDALGEVFVQFLRT